jgi:hypothetical protein
MAFVFANPALGDLVQRHWIEVMQLLASAPDRGDKVRFFEQNQMSRCTHNSDNVCPFFLNSSSSNCLRLASANALNTASIQGKNMQPKGCMSSGEIRMDDFELFSDTTGRLILSIECSGSLGNLPQA